MLDIEYSVIKSDVIKSFDCTYSKCSKILNTFLFLFSNKMIIRAGMHKMLVIIANREDPV